MISQILGVTTVQITLEKKELTQQEAKGNKWKSNSALESREENMTQSRKEK